VHRQANLLQVVGALHLGGGGTNLLHRRQKQADEHGNDGNYHKQFDQGESRPG
jgi:hypothetical protein